jgi:hypothetical protein
MNKYSYSLIGSVVAIVSARTYVFLGGSLDFTIFNHVLHHFYYGVSLLIFAGILKLRKVPESLIFFVVGLGLGFISDEFDLLLSIGRSYTLQLYYAPLNLSMDVILVLVLFRLSQSSNYVYGLLVDTEHVL